MLLGELRRGYPSQAAVGPDLIVVLAPSDGGTSRLVKRFEPMLVEVLALAEKVADFGRFGW